MVAADHAGLRSLATSTVAGRIRAVLAQVPDPEIPALSIVDLGIVRDVTPARVLLTPTYTGCPATLAIEAMVRIALDQSGFGEVEIETTLSPPWTTDWISAEGRASSMPVGRPLASRSTSPRSNSGGLVS